MKLNQLKLNSKTLTAFSLPVLLAVAGCDGTSLSDVESDLANGGTVGIDLSTNDDGNLVISTGGGDDGAGGGAAAAAGGVFVMSNILEGNTIVAYSRAADGTLSLVGEFATGGNGGDFD